MGLGYPIGLTDRYPEGHPDYPQGWCLVQCATVVPTATAATTSAPATSPGASSWAPYSAAATQSARSGTSHSSRSTCRSSLGTYRLSTAVRDEGVGTSAVHTGDEETQMSEQGSERGAAEENTGVSETSEEHDASPAGHDDGDSYVDGAAEENAGVADD